VIKLKTINIIPAHSPTITSVFLIEFFDAADGLDEFDEPEEFDANEIFDNGFEGVLLFIVFSPLY